MATIPAQSSASSARLRDRRFYLFVTILTAALVFAGFARTFFLNGFFAKLHLPSLYIIHGVVFSSWLVVLVTQATLVSTAAQFSRFSAFWLVCVCRPDRRRISFA